MDNEIKIINAIQPQEKYSLEKTIEEKLELRVFFMGLSNDMKPPEHVTKLVGVVAYRHSDALQKAQQVWANQFGTMIFSKGDSETIKNLLQYVKLEGITIPTVTPDTPKEPEKVMPIERFKTSLIMAAVEYVKNEADQSELRRIISTIHVPN